MICFVHKVHQWKPVSSAVSRDELLPILQQFSQPVRESLRTEMEAFELRKMEDAGSLGGQMDLGVEEEDNAWKKGEGDKTS